MKKTLYTLATLLLITFTACEDDDKAVFDKTADERAAEAIANLRADLIAPENGWRIKYRPQDGAGAFYVLLDFEENGKVGIKSDLGAEDGRYFDQTLSYRIDNSLGLELIFENYSFFSFLFELDQATFGAEYEFNFVNKTPDGALVFRSKTDVSTPDIIVFEPASASDPALLGTAVSQNLNTLANDLDKFTSSVKMTFADRDLALYIAMDAVRRTFTVTSASLKSNTQTTQAVNFTSAYYLEGDAIVLDDPLEKTILGQALSFSSIHFQTFDETSVNVCADPLTFHNYTGITSENEAFLFETSLLDVNGRSFATASTFYFSPLVYIFDNGRSLGNEIPQNIPGALELHLYYGLELAGGEKLNGIGFVIQNPDNTITFALREFTPEWIENKLVFHFNPDVTLFGNTDAEVNTEMVKAYLDPLAEGDNTYVFQLNTGIYEFFNPCTGWSFVLVDAEG